MMVEIKQITMFFSLLLVLRITGTTGRYSSVVKKGDDATLSCANMNVHECGQIDFTFDAGSYRTYLVQDGQIKNNGKVTTDRLRMTEDCSLVIKEVKPEDAGVYYCHLKRHQHVEYTLNWLSVVTFNEQEVHGEMMLTCSVSTYTHCDHPVKWLYGDNEVTKDNKDIGLSQTTCRSTVTFKKSINTELFMCQVEDRYSNTFHLFPFRPRSSGRDTTTPASVTTEGSKSPTTNSTTHAISHPPISGLDWWWYIAVAVGFVVILVIVIVVIRWTRNKGSEKQMNSGVEVNLHTADIQCAAEDIEDTVDPENGICYASVNYTKKINSKNQVEDMDDEEGTVTYSAVKCSRSAAVTSTDLNNIYAAIKK